ncbi:heterokaryon incompatibility protein-domain-containing protein [Fusarium sp. MPI-SDFR-AT-0072]|nr:heterokaryon incompatibility protein-domain-containing protein [Fusarium sp. MPI-SDFR-AT-0072]
MDKSHSNDYHIAIVAPLPEDYETAKALLDEPEQEYHLIISGAACSLGKVGPHNVVLVGKAEDMTNVSVFVKDIVDDLLEAFPSIRAGSLIGVDATAPEESLAKPGDIVVAFPQGFQPGQVQFDGNETIVSNRISTTFEMSHPSSYIKSIINTIQSPEGRQHWGQYLQRQSSRAELASTKDQQPLERNTDKANTVLRVKVASSARLLSDHDLANRVGCDSKIMCFERAGASIKSRFPILTICGILSSTSSCSPKLNESALRQIKVATVIYTMFVSHRISTAKLEDEHAFTNRFQYEPFDLESAGFRLVLLEKGVQSQLRCKLWQAYLNDIISYEALSYSWGSQSTPHEIIVDETILSITESLYEALWHLRRPDEDRMLWVDALCIDQNNIKERGHQVNRMGEIYGKADKVTIWLGYLSGNAAKLKSAITLFEDRVEKLPGIPRKQPREDPRWKSQWKQVEADLGPSCHDELVDGLQSFMEKPWFSRVWVLQEVANAKRTTVKCNLGETPGRIFALLPSVMDVKVTEQCQAVLDIMPDPSKPSTSRKQNRNLCNLLWKFRGCKATDPRDRIYALIGIASDRETVGIQADYSKEEKVVIREFCEHLLGQDWAASLPASTIEELQSKLPSVPKELLMQKLEKESSVDSLKQFICRQGPISALDYSAVLEIMQHGSEIMSQFLDQCKEKISVRPKTALRCLQKYPNVLEVLLQRPDFIIEDMPKFIAQAMEHRPEFLERLLGSSSESEQLRDDALMEAISRGMPSCQPFLNQCRHSVKITQKMLRRAVFASSRRGRVLELLLEVAESPVPWSENTFLEATLDEPKGVRFVNEKGQPALITKELISDGIDEGEQVLRFYLNNMEEPIELEEDLFLKAIEKVPKLLESLLKRSIHPFNVTEKVYEEAFRAGSEVFKLIFRDWASRPRITERLVELGILCGSGYIEILKQDFLGKL